jgi:Fe-S oxidoreductase
VPPDHVGAYLRDLDGLFKKYGYQSALYGHFGDGCIHCRIDFGLRTEEGVAHWRAFLSEAADLVVSHGGSISGEHGDGQSKAELLGKMYGPDLLSAFREFKAIWDPEGRMNPGKIVDPYPITSNLRLGPDYHPPELKTRFTFPTEGGGFERAAMRCVGVGECRRHSTQNGVMCPSYMATREERHSTRGRGHLLFEMMHGGPIKGGWRSPEVEEALDLCLACKGCKRDCPVNVDMATYKAEFRYHHYAGRLRPRAAYSMGLIYWWSRAASRVPGFANLLMQTPGLSAAVKFIGGLAPQRQMPAYARQTFRDWFRGYRTRNPGGPEVLLFPDTFNNFFRPQTAVAAVQVLEKAGWRVTIPPRSLCCGRPLYDWGMLDAADYLLRQLLGTLAPGLARGVPIVGLEPACVAAFRDEVPVLFPRDERAKRLEDQSYLLSEFLDRKAKEVELPQLGHGRKALTQIHCHEHAVLDSKAEERVLQRLGFAPETMPTGCCGMAGSFGFEAAKFQWSRKIAEHALLPQLEAAPPDAVVLANGFSCREQIEGLAGRETRHLAEVIAEGMGFVRWQPPRTAALGDMLLAAGGAAAGGLLAAALYRAATRGASNKAASPAASPSPTASATPG